MPLHMFWYFLFSNFNHREAIPHLCTMHCELCTRCVSSAINQNLIARSDRSGQNLLRDIDAFHGLIQSVEENVISGGGQPG